MKLYQILLGSLIFFVCTVSHAATISYGNYSHDDQTDIVVGDGLEWLQWDRTIGWSWNYAQTQLDTIEGGGWSIATNAQMASLFNNFAFGIEFDGIEETSQAVYTPLLNGGVMGMPYENDVTFVSMFGDTYFYTTNVTVYGMHYSRALYGDDANQNGLINQAQIYDDYLYNNVSHRVGRASLSGDLTGQDFSTSYAGVALVRSTLAPVPVPATLPLFASGLLGLALARLRKLQA